jgi:K+-sensing histidine kinase KdpD
MAEETVIEHPNRRKPAAQLARLVVVVLLLATAVLLLITTLGGWDTFEGDKPILILFIAIYLVLALFVARWSRGVLMMGVAMAVFLGIFAVLAAPSWFDRDAPGYTDPGLSSAVLGLLCILIAALQAALIIVGLIAFRQRWNVEVERPRAEPAPA